MTLNILELDGRKRVTLGSMATAERYIVEVEADGTIVLTPAVVMSHMEAALLARPDILELVEESRASNETAPAPVRRSPPGPARRPLKVPAPSGQWRRRKSLPDGGGE